MLRPGRCRPGAICANCGGNWLPRCLRAPLPHSERLALLTPTWRAFGMAKSRRGSASDSEAGSDTAGGALPAPRIESCTLNRCTSTWLGKSMQGCAAERSRPVRQSFAKLLSTKLVSLQNNFGVDSEFGLRVIAGQVAASLLSSRAASGHTTGDAPPVQQGAVPPRLQEAEARRLQHAFGIKREFALRLLRERGVARLSTSARRQVHTHRRLPVDYHCLEVQDAVEMQPGELGQPTRMSEFVVRCSRKGALQTAWGVWCRWAAAKAKRAAAPRRRLEGSGLRSNRVATSFKAWRTHRLSFTAAAARRLHCDTRQGKRAMRWAWKHLVRSSVSRGLRIVPLQVAWRIWRASASADRTLATHALNKSKVTEKPAPSRPPHRPDLFGSRRAHAGEQAPPGMVNLASPASPIFRRSLGKWHARLCQRCHCSAAPVVHVTVNFSRRRVAGSRSAGQWSCSHAQMGRALSEG